MTTELPPKSATLEVLQWMTNKLQQAEQKTSQAYLALAALRVKLEGIKERQEQKDGDTDNE